MPIIAAMGTFLAALFLKKLVVAFGFAFVAYQGLDYIFDQLKDYFYHGYHSMPLATIQLLEIGGFKKGIEILFGCISARIAMFAYDKFEIGMFNK